MRSLVFIATLFIFLIYACQSTPDSPIVKSSDNFPEDWLGTWAGTLIISKPGGDTMQVPMQLYYAENDTLDNAWDWHILL